MAIVLSRYREEIGHLDGLLALDLYSNTIEKTSYGNKATKAFSSLFTTGKNTFGVASLEGTSILMQAMNKCSDPANRECVNDMIRDTVDLDGLMRKITIQKNGKAQRPLIVNRIRNGRLEFVVKVY